MPTENITCPQCSSSNVAFSKKRQLYVCAECEHTFAGESQIPPRRIFISYGHDEHAALAKQLKQDLTARGHEVWFDADRLQPGGDWESNIEQGLDWVCELPGVGQVVLLITPHSVRRPDGYCLNEIARALDRRLRVVPVMVVWSEPPLSICRIQWLDMQDCVPVQDRQQHYQTKFRRLAEALEHNRLDFEGVQSRLFRLLQPLPFDADLNQHLPRFTGRQWVFDRIDAWLADPQASRVFWISGAPGVGKTALASWLCAHRREVAAFHLCRAGHDQKADPRQCVLSLAYQLSSQLLDYQMRLSALDLEQLISGANARTLFDALIVQPLNDRFPRPDHRILVLIDALDEATKDGRNELASFLASEFARTPDWLRLVLTSRPEPEVLHLLQGLTPYVLDASAAENEADIRAYLARELKPFTPSPELPAAVIDRIVERSEGVFLYVEWIRRELAEGRLSLGELERFPQGLGEVYAQFFVRQFPDLASYEHTIRPVLEVLAAAREPLAVTLLASLFGWSEYDQAKAINSLGTLFPVVEGDRIRAYHRSVMDWLTDIARAGRYFVSQKAGHRRLAAHGWDIHAQETPRLPDYFLRHLPQHLTLAGHWDKLEQLLIALPFLEAKADAGLVFELGKDFTEAVAALPPERPARRLLQLIEEALRADIHFIARHPTTLFQCLWNRCWWYDCPDAAKHYDPPDDGWPPEGPPWERRGPKLYQLLEAWRAAKLATNPRFGWLRCLRPPLHHLGTASNAVFRGHTKGVNSVTVSSDGRHIVSGSEDGTVRIWDAASGQELHCLTGHMKGVHSVKVSPDAQHIISGSEDRTIRVWDMTSGREVHCLEGHTGGVLSVAVSPDGRHIVSGSGDRTVRVWDAANGQALRCLEGHTDGVLSVAVSPDGRHIVSGGVIQTVRVWDAASGQQVHCLRGHMGTVRTVAVSPDGQHIFSGADDATVRVWDTVSGQPLCCLSGHMRTVRDVASSLDGRQIVSGGVDQTVRVWDVSSGQQLYCLRGHTGGVRSVAFSPDGRRVVSGSGDMTVRVWNVGPSPQLWYLKGHRGSVECVAISPDGRKSVSGADDATVRIWDTASGRQDFCLKGHTSWVLCVAFSPDGRQIVSGSVDQTVRLWDVAGGQELLCLEGHTDRVTMVAFSPDGRRIVSRASNSQMRVWDAGSGECLSRNSSTFSEFRPKALQESSSSMAVAVPAQFPSPSTHVRSVWFPVDLMPVTAHPPSRTWAGAVGNYLCLFTLEGEPNSQELDSAREMTTSP